MKPSVFDYHRPGSVDEATAQLAGLEGEVRPLAGGQSLVPLMNLRLAQPDHLVDLADLAELRSVRSEGAALVTGAMVRHRQLIEDPEIICQLPLLAEAARSIGHTHIRNRGTVGGSLAHADPAAELPAVAVALDAELVVAGPNGRRTIAGDEFFIGHFTTALEPGELLVEIRWPATGPGWGFRELARKQGDFATVLAAVAQRADRSWCLVLGSVGAAPIRVREAEAQLGRGTPDQEQIEAATSAIGAAIRPSDDVHATARYRQAMAAHLIGEALTDARGRCR